MKPKDKTKENKDYIDDCFRVLNGKEPINEKELLLNVVSCSICECGEIAFKEMEEGRDKCSICNKEF